MAATRQWRSHDSHGQYLMPQLQQPCGHCNHQHASCRCHGGFHNTYNHQHHHHGNHHSHHSNHHAHHSNRHFHHNNRQHYSHGNTYPFGQTQVIHRHYTEQESSGPKLIPLPPPQPKPTRSLLTETDNTSQQDVCTQNEESQVELPCSKCEGGRCTIHDTEPLVIFQCPECEADRDYKLHHQETQAEGSCQECEQRTRCTKYDMETQASSECEACERNRCIKHDAETQVSTSCPDCDRMRYCKNDMEMQVNLGCEECEIRRGVTTRDMATQVEDFDVKVTEGQTKEVSVKHEKVTESSEHDCQICSVLLEKLKKSDFLDEETIGSYVITKTSKPQVKITKKESFRTSTPRQGVFDTFAEHLRDAKY